MSQPDLIYDVGMHKGEDASFYLAKGFRVIAFEADPELVRKCRERFAEALRNRQLVIVEGAIVDDSLAPHRGVRFFRNLDNSVWGTTDQDWKERNDSLGTRSEVIEVAAVNFSECLQRYGIPHYMKVDIEGGDLICIRALNAFRERPSYISIESEKVSFSKLEREIDLLAELGYNRFQAVPQAEVALQVPPNPALEGIYVPHAFQSGASGLFGAELSGRWISARAVLAQYRRIFWGYRLFGDRSRFARTRLGSRARLWLSRRLGRQIPGWFDTHARHKSVTDS